ncbi:MAG: hypothetical protein KJ017_05450 [Alphaproteobacteria bacterium]|nr:hypothetical protein [Alphaproteobacteria bacterium]
MRFSEQLKFLLLFCGLCALSPSIVLAQEAPKTGYFRDPKRLFQYEPKLPIAIKYDCKKQDSGVLACSFTTYRKSTIIKNRRYCYTHKLSTNTDFSYYQESANIPAHWKYENTHDKEYCDSVYREIFYPIFDTQTEDLITGWRYVTGSTALNAEEKSPSGELCSRYDKIFRREYITSPDDSFLKEECDEIVEAQ